jgi:nucleoside-diphosphate-sugar epimerase
MNVFVAGGTGTVGIPLVRALVAAGHQVTALTRSSAKRNDVLALGASAAVADALDRQALMAAVSAARPTHVIHQLTALPPYGVRRARDLQPTNRLRIEGTRNLLEAALAVHARRFVVGSFAALAAAGQEAPIDDEAAAAVQSMESQVLEATRRGLIEGIILRYGLFYGFEAPSTVAMIDQIRKRRLPVVRHDASRLPLIHVEDVVSATVRALDAGRPGTAYEIVDDRAVSLTEIVQSLADYTGSPPPLRVPAWLPRLIAPYMSRVTSVRLQLSNARAKAELGWRPAYPTMRDGLAQMFRKAA